ncbi:MAG: hypothetical protein VKL01_04070 [Limnothrix sp.]|uniref:hypothetical protein n=1 Tax=unclassified Limnothrix TaxID=2632864 RepID=UPI001304307B|nr:MULTISPECIES: hypothetical protein [unclassified Limnothrix]MBD2554285.1 hypothetical protein [Limnothrix sp. FACHB-708]MBD2591426.1 hypothetical protein [Limnothrix sp. FACHB-406]MEB3117523.1 hypothetical protein [Limnothrix sp.]
MRAIAIEAGNRPDRAQAPTIISIFLLLLKKIKSGAIARAYIPPSDFTQSPPRSPG